MVDINSESVNFIHELFKLRVSKKTELAWIGPEMIQSDVLHPKWKKERVKGERVQVCNHSPDCGQP